MAIDYNLFEDILGFDSTSGKERPLAEFLSHRLSAPKVETFEVGDGTLNPKGSTTRAQSAALLQRFDGLRAVG